MGGDKCSIDLICHVLGQRPRLSLSWREREAEAREALRDVAQECSRECARIERVCELPVLSQLADAARCRFESCRLSLALMWRRRV